MTITIETKFDIGDEVYIADHHYDFFALKQPYAITDVSVQSSRYGTNIIYRVKREDIEHSIPESWAFATYEECLKWCNTHN